MSSSLVPRPSASSALSARKDDKKALQTLGQVRNKQLLAGVRLAAAHDVAADGWRHWNGLANTMAADCGGDPIKSQVAMSILSEYQAVVGASIRSVGMPSLYEQVMG